MSALEQARQIKNDKEEAAEKAAEEENLKQESRKKWADQLREIMKKVLAEFAGVNEIQVRVSDNCVELVNQNGTRIFQAIVGSKTYENPNLDYKREETVQAIKWETLGSDRAYNRAWDSSQNQKGFDTNEKDFINSVSRVMAQYI